MEDVQKHMEFKTLGHDSSCDTAKAHEAKIVSDIKPGRGGDKRPTRAEKGAIDVLNNLASHGFTLTEAKEILHKAIRIAEKMH